jgi:Holliday junction resolvasome RuvABC endonuclease subunit
MPHDQPQRRLGRGGDGSAISKHPRSNKLLDDPTPFPNLFRPVLALDLGTKKTGWAVVTRDDFPAWGITPDVLAELATLVAQWKPAEVAIETYNPLNEQLDDMDSRMLQLQYHLIAKANQLGIPVFGYGRQAVKRWLVGSIRFTKWAIRDSIRRQFPIVPGDLRDDVYDAMAVGLLHLFYPPAGKCLGRRIAGLGGMPDDVVRRLEALGFRDPDRRFSMFDPAAVIQALEYAEYVEGQGQAKSPAGLMVYWLRRNAEIGEPIPMPPRKRSPFDGYRTPLSGRYGDMVQR